MLRWLRYFFDLRGWLDFIAWIRNEMSLCIHCDGFGIEPGYNLHDGPPCTKCKGTGRN